MTWSDATAIEYLVEYDPADPSTCSHSEQWALQVDDPTLARVLLFGPHPLRPGLTLPLGEGFIDVPRSAGEPSVVTRITGGQAEILEWTASRRRLQVTDGRLCGLNDVDPPTCDDAPVTVVTVEAAFEPPQLPPATCVTGNEPLPDWPGDGPGPCAFGDEPCPE